MASTVGSGQASGVAVVMVNYRTPELALTALAALAAERERVPGLHAVLVDGGSGDGSAERLAAGLADPRFAGWAELLPLEVNGGFGWANNQGMLRLLQGAEPPAYIHLLNPDAEVEPGAVARLAAVLDGDPRCGAVGSQLLDEDGRPSGSAFQFPSVASELQRGLRSAALGRMLGVQPGLSAPAVAGEVDWVTGASVMLRSAALRESGLFDDGFFLYFEEVEMMARMRRAGWTIRHEPASRVRHIGGASTGITYGTEGLHEAPSPPDYWFASRRRLFARMNGRGGAVAAGLAWLAGHGLFKARRLAGLGGGHVPARHEGRMFLRHGVAPTMADLTPAIVRWDDTPGSLPAWMERRRPSEIRTEA